MSTEKTSSNRGGARTGAGRPPKPGPKLSEVRGLRVPDAAAVLARLDAVAPGLTRGEQLAAVIEAVENGSGVVTTTCKECNGTGWAVRKSPFGAVPLCWACDGRGKVDVRK